VEEGAKDVGPIFSANGDQMVLVRPVREGRLGFFPQVVQSSAKPGAQGTAEPTSLTHGPFTVTEIVGWDEKNHLV